MSSFAERNREAIIRQLQGDPRLGEAEVLSAAPLMRVSVMMLIIWGIVGAILMQVLLGSGGIQFGLGLVAGYAAYVGYLWRTMGEPKVIGAMAVLTATRFVLLGSRRVGIAADWDLRDLEDIELVRKGNLLIMGKIVIKPAAGEPTRFFLSNRGMGRHLVEQYENMRKT